MNGKRSRNKAPILSPDAVLYYWDHPVEFVEDNILAPAREFLPGVQATPHQRDFLNEISKNNRIAIESGHGTGKSAVFSWAIIFYLCTRGNMLGYTVKVPCIAPTYHQLQDILWPELRRWIPRSRLGPLLQIQKDEVWWNNQKDGVFARARTAIKPEHVQGFHAAHLLWIVDEAFGIVNNQIWETIEGSLTEEDNKIVMGGQHTVIVGYVHDAFHRDAASWKCLRFNSVDSSLTKKDYVERIKSKYGEDSDIYRVRVLGTEPKGNPEAFIQLTRVLTATQREVENIGPVRMGVDPARFGDDSTVVTLAKGNHVFPQVIKGKLDTDGIVELTIQTLKEYRGCTSDNTTAEINIDTTGGYGAGPYDALKKLENVLNIEVYMVQFVGKKIDPEFYDGVSAMWGELRDIIDQIHLPEDDALVEEVSSRRFKIVADNKIRIEPKEEFKKEYGASPDRADSLVVCFTQKARIRTVLQVKGTEMEQKFNVDFSDLSEFTSLICSIWVQKDLSTRIIYGVWNARKVKFWVFGAQALTHPRQDALLVQAAAYLREITGDQVRALKKFRILGSPLMHSPTETDALNDMATAYMKSGLNVEENYFWDEGGAVLLVSRLIQRKALKIHPRCEEVSTEIMHWTTAKGRPDDGYGYARALCNAVSACVEDSRYDPLPQSIKPWSRESQEIQTTFDRLIRMNPDKFETMTDDDVNAMRQTVSAENDDKNADTGEKPGAHWL